MTKSKQATPRPWDEINEILPPLATHRRDALRQSIEDHGYNGPPVYVMPDGRIIDGHNRWEITGGNCPVEVLDVDEETGRSLALAHNMARRQLSHEELKEVERARKEVYKQLRPTMTQKEAAEAAGDVPQPTAARWDDEVENESDIQPDITFEIPDGRVNIPKSEKPKIIERHEAGESHTQIAADYGTTGQRIGQIIKQEKSRKENEAKVEEIAEKKAEGFDKLYDVIVMDPPWPMKKIDREVAPEQSAFDYPTMTVEEIRAQWKGSLPAKTNCHFWLWTTHKYLPPAIELLNAWALKYVCAFVWHKPGGFQPYNLPQYNCEFAVYARKGSPEFVTTKDFKLCFEAKRTGHSAKPEEFYDLVRRVTEGNRVDIYNRRPIKGFDCWGNES